MPIRTKNLMIRIADLGLDMERTVLEHYRQIEILKSITALMTLMVAIIILSVWTRDLN